MTPRTGYSILKFQFCLNPSVLNADAGMKFNPAAKEQFVSRANLTLHVISRPVIVVACSVS